MALSQSDLDFYLARQDEKTLISPRPSNVPVPLSFGQEQIWLHGLLESELPLYNETVTIRYDGVLHYSAFDKSLREIISRHEIWRTSVQLVDGIPHQVIHPERLYTLSQADLSGLPASLRHREAHRLAEENARKLFDLANDSLLRVLLVKLDDTTHLIYLTLHHLIFDGVALRHIFFPEFLTLYSGYAGETCLTLPPPPLQYGDYACWQRSTAARANDSSLAYWSNQLENVQRAGLPSDRPRTSRTRHHGAVHAFIFDASLMGAVKQFRFQERATLFNVMASGLIMLLARYTGNEDIILGTIVSERTEPRLEMVLGYFLNTVVLRVDVSDNPGFIELQGRVREVMLSALSHADAPFQQVVRELAGSHDAHAEMLQVVLSLQPLMDKLPPEWSLDFFDVSNGTAKFDLHIELEEQPDHIVGRVLYNTELFDSSTVQRLIQHWAALLLAALVEPQKSIWKLPMLSRAEHHWLVEQFNQTQSDYPDLCLPELFARRAIEAPLRLAATCQDEALTYRQLDARSTQIANYLLCRGLGETSVIGLMMDRGLDMLIALLGILKAGATYVPMDPRYPAARLALMLRATAAKLLITHSSLQSSLPADHPPLLQLDEDATLISNQPTSLAHVRPLAPSSPCYIIFTSGSTGEPKGVEISHRALTNLLWSMRGKPGISSDDVLLAVTSISFDIAALELFLPLISGARVEIATSEEASSPMLLIEALKRSGATLMQATPATWRVLADSGWEGDLSLTIFCGGEALAQKLAAQLLSRSKSVWNMYGPTETTIWSACCRVEDAESEIPIGEPIANTSLYVLDAHQQLAPIGVPGELYIGGDGLAKGYWNNETESVAKFLEIAIGGDEPRRLYRTGDRVIRRVDGSITFVGRNDTQIKLHGFRIELGEIENAIHRLPGVQSCIVVKVSHEVRGDLLVAYLVPHAHVQIDVSALREKLKSVLPAHMRPSLFYELDAVPLTPNGKVDRGRLPSPFQDHQGSDHESPHEGVEETLAALWRAMLQLQHVGREEDFFDLGGHSLLAVQLLTRIEAEFGQRISFATLLQAPTIAQLARVIDGRTLPPATLIKSGASPYKHLFWIGAAPWLRQLAAYLTPDQTLFTLTISPESLSLFAPSYKLEDMAAHLRERILSVKPEGPYLIGGFCKEAILAYEVAQQLRREGREVPLLIIGDTFPPGQIRASLSDLKIRVKREMQYLARLLYSPQAMAGFYRGRKGALKLVLHRSKWRKRGTSKTAPAELPQTLLEALFMAEMRYEVRPYAGSVLFLEAGGRGSLPHWSTFRNWRALLEQSELLVYPGEHLDLHKDVCLSLAGRGIAEAVDRSVSDSITMEEALDFLKAEDMTLP